MNAQAILDGLNQIDDRYVACYVPVDPEKAKKDLFRNHGMSRTFIKWAAIAACFTVVLSIGIRFFLQGNQKASGDFWGDVYHKYEKYQDFENLLPDKSIFRNLPDRGFEVSGIGVWYEKGFDNDMERFQTISLGLAYGADAHASGTLVCEKGMGASLDEESERMVKLGFGSIKIVQVNGVTVCYGFRYGIGHGIFHAGFQIDSGYCTLNLDMEDEEAFLTILEQLFSE